MNTARSIVIPWWVLIVLCLVAFLSPSAARAQSQCQPGQVWRDNFDGDTVCVSPDERHRLANGTCSSGYVWRDTFNGDNVCVTPAKRAAIKAQKRRDELGVVTNRPGAAA